jgi:hypothetical protein
MFPPISCAKDYIIHTDDNVYYYPDVDRNDTIVLPNDEIIDTDNLLDLQDNQEPYRTNEGVEIYQGYDNQLFMEGGDYENGIETE